MKFYIHLYVYPLSRNKTQCFGNEEIMANHHETCSENNGKQATKMSVVMCNILIFTDS